MGRSFRLWIAEVDDVVAEASRISREQHDDGLAALLSGELESARALAENQPLARKSFRFAPSATVARLAERAIASARGTGVPT